MGPTAGFPIPLLMWSSVGLCYGRDPLVEDANDALSDCDHERP